LSEAIEWLITGELSRRKSGAHGHPKELSDCITNEFRPAGEATWVEAVLNVDGKLDTFRRELVRDYGDAANAEPESRVTLNRDLLSPEQVQLYVEKLWAGIHPILMQHTLGEFVHSSPAERRQYFERLLQIEHLTVMIEKAVVGDAELRNYPSLGAGAAPQLLSAFLDKNLTQTSRNLLKSIQKGANIDAIELDDVLAKVARAEFELETPVAEASETLKADLSRVRQQEFKELQQVRELAAISAPDLTVCVNALFEYARELDRYAEAAAAAEKVREADLVLGRAIHDLRELGLIDERAAAQICPLCESDSPSLTNQRATALLNSAPLVQAVDRARASVADAERRWNEHLKGAAQTVSRIQFTRPHIEVALYPAPMIAAANHAFSTADAVHTLARRCDEVIENLRPDVLRSQLTNMDALLSKCRTLQNELHEGLMNVKKQLNVLEREVGFLAQTNEAYAAKEAFVALSDQRSQLLNYTRWVFASKQAQRMLAEIRKGLIDLRSGIIDVARQAFNKQMIEVWKALRSDPGGEFSEIVIPTPRGKGYKLEFEVKASINDGKRTAVVDALRVFSESQMNVLGIAAYVTRAAALGHTVLIFDDPVQSMDEEHFKALAGKLLSQLLDSGHQVIVFTHSETFARDISHAHFLRSSYATMTARYSKRRGSYIEERSRRVAERLKSAEDLAEDGKLEEGWGKVRLALERLYTVVMKANDPDFNPESWRDQPGEYMWNAGAGNVITARVQDSGPKLREILSMTAAGAHDKRANSKTELLQAIAFIRGLLTPLRGGDG